LLFTHPEIQIFVDIQAENEIKILTQWSTFNFYLDPQVLDIQPI